MYRHGVRSPTHHSVVTLLSLYLGVAAQADKWHFSTVVMVKRATVYPREHLSLVKLPQPWGRESNSMTDLWSSKTADLSVSIGLCRIMQTWLSLTSTVTSGSVGGEYHLVIWQYAEDRGCRLSICWEFVYLFALSISSLGSSIHHWSLLLFSCVCVPCCRHKMWVREREIERDSDWESGGWEGGRERERDAFVLSLIRL